MTKNTLLIIYFVGFPMAGLMVGFVFFHMLNFATGPLSPLAFEISVFGWGGAGLISGIYGFFLFSRMRK